MWLTKTNPVHIGQYGTFITTKNVSKSSAIIDLNVSIDNNSKVDATVDVNTRIYALDTKGNKTGNSVANFSTLKSKVVEAETNEVNSSINLINPKLWGPEPTQTPNLYVALTTLSLNGTDGKDLAFITVKVTDKDGLTVPRSNNLIEFSIEGSGDIIATDNGDPTNIVSFPSKEREAFNGLCLVIVRSRDGNAGSITVTAKSPGLKYTQVTIQSK